MRMMYDSIEFNKSDSNNAKQMLMWFALSEDAEATLISASLCEVVYQIA